MYLSYLDESGTPGDKNTDFFVLGGVTVFERQTHWLEREMDTIANRYQQKSGSYLELHAAPMRNRKEGWDHDNITPTDRIQASADVLRLLQGPQIKVNVFATVIEKSQMLRTADILPYCFEMLATKVDDFLAYKYQKHRDPARGIFVLDRKQALEEANMQALHHTFKHLGHGNGKLRNFAEVPMFVDSKATRLIQLADSICYWIYRRYQSLDDRGWQLIQPYLANLGNGRTGLHEVLAPTTPAKLANIPPNPHPFPPPLAVQPAQAVVAPAAAPGQAAAPAVAAQPAQAAAVVPPARFAPTAIVTP
ncbi:DUF3800 domain-containing protein [Burkholderia cenocepacia]|uniref:DUF3800 domain-containing protein n=1 Tax=Burkholderia cenocepacia TaxID=95486 RepID=UPI001B8E0D79|nr:DUF3800 domain-containing protein [Burkholderia cenocepacia]MBR8396634.1 DUF3800 domain-containing protein [Burkholderia cenocepacia]